MDITSTLSNTQLIEDYQSFTEMIFEEPDEPFIDGHISYLYDVTTELEKRLTNEHLKKEVDDFDYEFSDLKEEVFRKRLDAIVINLKLSLA